MSYLSSVFATYKPNLKSTQFYARKFRTTFFLSFVFWLKQKQKATKTATKVLPNGTGTAFFLLETTCPNDGLTGYLVKIVGTKEGSIAKQPGGIQPIQLRKKGPYAKAYHCYLATAPHFDDMKKLANSLSFFKRLHILKKDYLHLTFQLRFYHNGKNEEKNQNAFLMCALFLVAITHGGRFYG